MLTYYISILFVHMLFPSRGTGSITRNMSLLKGRHPGGDGLQEPHLWSVKKRFLHDLGYCRVTKGS